MILPTRAYRAGETLEDFCRACKTDRMHTVVAADTAGSCSRRAGIAAANTTIAAARVEAAGVRKWTDLPPAPAGCPPIVTVCRSSSAADREPFPSSANGKGRAQDRFRADDLEALLRRIIREESGISPVVPAKWRGGTLVLRPARGLQEKSWPIETFFHKVVMLRNRLRTLEQQVNASDLPDK